MRLWLEHSSMLTSASLPRNEKLVSRARPISLAGASTALVCLLGLPDAARAAFIPPTGVSEYRLIFTTADSITGASSDIATYNSFATVEAGLAGDLPSTIWSAVASTDSIDAVSNIACTPDCSGIPIFLVDGTEVAASSTALFNAASVALLSGMDEDQYGDLTGGGYVWTGSNSDGTAAAGVTLGSASYANFGGGGQVGQYALNLGGFDVSSQFPILAISGVIDAPEPMSAALLGFAGIATGLVGRFRRHRKAASAG